MKTLHHILLTVFFSLFIFACEKPEGPQQPQKPSEPENPTGPSDPSDPSEPKDREFVILFTNDFHSQIEPLSKEETYNADRGGIKRIKAPVEMMAMEELGYDVRTLGNHEDEVIGTCPSAIRKGSPESPLGNLTADGRIVND